MLLRVESAAPTSPIRGIRLAPPATILTKRALTLLRPPQSPGGKKYYPELHGMPRVHGGSHLLGTPRTFPSLSSQDGVAQVL